MWILKEMIMAMSDHQNNCIIATLYINVHKYIRALPYLLKAHEITTICQRESSQFVA